MIKDVDSEYPSEQNTHLDGMMKSIHPQNGSQHENIKHNVAFVTNMTNDMYGTQTC